jgi:hypothetical protein
MACRTRLHGLLAHVKKLVHLDMAASTAEQIAEENKMLSRSEFKNMMHMNEFQQSLLLYLNSAESIYLHIYKK